MLFGLFGVDKPKDASAHSHDHGHGQGSEHIHLEAHDALETAPDDIGQVALDVVETDDSIVILAPLAGVSKDAVDINLSRNILTISGKRNKPATLEGRALVSECFFGPFSRSVILPENLGLNKVRATMEDNLLIVSIPKLVIGTKSVKIERFASTSAAE